MTGMAKNHKDSDWVVFDSHSGFVVRRGRDVSPSCDVEGIYEKHNDAQLAADRANNHATQKAYAKRIQNMVDEKEGFDKALAKAILKRLLAVYPQPIPMPDHIADHPSFRNTLAVLHDRGLIDHLQIQRTLNGKSHVYFAGGNAAVALSEGGWVYMNRGVNWVAVAAVGSIIAAVAAIVAAIASIYQLNVTW